MYIHTHRGLISVVAVHTQAVMKSVHICPDIHSLSGIKQGGKSIVHQWFILRSVNTVWEICGIKCVSANNTRTLNVIYVAWGQGVHREECNSGAC